MEQEVGPSKAMVALPSLVLLAFVDGPPALASWPLTVADIVDREANEKREQQQTRIIPQNYNFRLLRTEVLEGRPQYVLEISQR